MLRFPTALLAASLLAACGGDSSSDAAAADRTKAAVVAAAPASAEEAPAKAEQAPAEATQPSADGWITYGGQMSDHEAVAASALITAPDAFVGKTIKVAGEVTAVCKSMGCWLSFQHDGEELTVNMADHAFSVDKQSAGYWCEAEGEVVRQGELVSLTAHSVRMKKPAASDEKAPAKEPTGEAAPEGSKG